MTPPVAPLDGTSPHVVTTSSYSDERPRVLKHGDTFAVFDHQGRIKQAGLGEEGLYHEGTRYLSRFSLELEDKPLIVLSSAVRAEDGHLTIALTNPDFVQETLARLPFGTLYVSVTTLLWEAVLYQRIRIKNYGSTTVATHLCLQFGADYADIFEIRGLERAGRGTDLATQTLIDGVVLGYLGLDAEKRETAIRFSPAPAQISARAARFHPVLKPKAEVVYDLSAACLRGSTPPQILDFDAARRASQADAERYRAWACHLTTSNGQVNAWLDRAASDLQMMTTQLPTGPYPYAGVPWFNTPFGRDGLLTALACLWLRPSVARGVLAYLASTQATETIAAQDAEPGKILHETRTGEMAVLGEMPFSRYYGSVDATPLFVLLAGLYHERTGDDAFLKFLWPNIEAAIQWLDTFGDMDGDGFTKYRQSTRGLSHQGWKDSGDAVSHADGSSAPGPIALCEVQGYVYAARIAIANVAEKLGKSLRAATLTLQADVLRHRFEDTFWCEELSTYAIALDGQGNLCRVRTSNSGQCLFTGIASEDHAQRLVGTLFSKESFSGWGVRTLAATENGYNPMGYHTGSVWPHDNALIAYGLARYGYQEKAQQLLTAQFDAGTHFELHRMPELFCGFSREPGETPVPYPVACAPQAWSAASVFLLFQSCLGLKISATDRRISFTKPQLPSSVSEMRIHHLEVAGTSVDLRIVREGSDVGVHVIRREGQIEVLVIK